MHQTHKYSFFQFQQPRTQALFFFLFFSSMLEENESAPVLTLRKANLSLFLSNSSCWFFSRASALHKPQHTPSQQTVTTHTVTTQTVTANGVTAQASCTMLLQCHCNNHQACYCTTTRNDITTQPQRYRGWPLSTGDYKFCIHG